MNLKRVRITFLLAAVALTGFSASPARAGDGGCEEQNLQAYQLEDGKRVFNDDRFQVFTSRMQTPVYRNPTGSDRAQQTLGFGQKFLVTDPGAGTRRIRIRKLSDEDVGWVER